MFLLREWDPEKGYTGREFANFIGYVLKECPEYGLMDGYVIFGWQRLEGGKLMNQKYIKLTQEEIKHNEDIELLKDYLSQYIRAKRRKAQLEMRLKNICEEMRTPIGGHGYSPINRPQNQISEGAASFTIRKSEEETRIEAQKEEVTKNLLKIMDVFDYLDENSDTRNVLELYYIDNYKWDRVAFEMHSSRSNVFKYARNGLEKLLTFKQIQKILKNYRDEIEGNKSKEKS